MQGVKLILKGKVQKIGLRNSFLKIAYDLKLKGYIKNLEDGSVEIGILNCPLSVQSLMKKIHESNSRFVLNSFETKFCDLDDYEDFKVLK